MHQKGTSRWPWTLVAWARAKPGSTGRTSEDSGQLTQKGNAIRAAMEGRIDSQSANMAVENRLKDGIIIRVSVSI